MPNWACGEMQLVLPTKNVDKFLEYAGDEQAPYFYRSSFELQDREDNPHGLTKLTFSVDCAWSAGGCLINRDEDNEDCLSLEAVCCELKVRRLAANFEEHGMMFGETITYDAESGIDHESFDLPEQAYIDFDDDEEYIEEDEETVEAAEEDCEENATESTVTLDDLIQGVPA